MLVTKRRQRALRIAVLSVLLLGLAYLAVLVIVGLSPNKYSREQHDFLVSADYRSVGFVAWYIYTPEFNFPVADSNFTRVIYAADDIDSFKDKMAHNLNNVGCTNHPTDSNNLIFGCPNGISVSVNPTEDSSQVIVEVR
jgi:hypothetical protein